MNLADNAVKYNQPGGTITVALIASNGTAEFRMSNSGPGISPECLRRVCERFFRADPAHDAGVEGCGLGLSIAQWIVSVHKGLLKIESVPNQITTVTVHLPLSASAAV